MTGKLTPEERLAAERRIEELKVAIQAHLNGDGPLDERAAQWKKLLVESLELQEVLSRDDAQPA